MPELIQIVGNTIDYVYAASGVKQSVKHTPVNGESVTRSYSGNKVYENGSLKMILTEEGYVEKDGSSFNHYYYLKDHLGSNRVVLDASGNIVQSTEYYPFGAHYTQSTNQEKQPYKFGGKELDHLFDLDCYDFEARMYDPILGRFMTMDPLSEKYYSISPYAYCNNNPVKYVDPTGMDWYKANDGTIQYEPGILSQEYLGGNGTYIGKTHQVENENEKGKVMENYREDGSIMFSDEASGYRRIWNNTQKTGNEEMGVITNEGVLVLPSWDNDPTTSKVKEYGYSFEKGKLIDPVSDDKVSFSGTVHTHPNVVNPSLEDYVYFGNNTPNIPFYIFNPDMRISAIIPRDTSTATSLILPLRGQNIGGIIIWWLLIKE